MENLESTEPPLNPADIDHELNVFAEKLKEFYTNLNSKFTDCFFKTTKSTADAIRKRVLFGDSKEANPPMVLSTLTLENNIIVLNPSVEELQECLSQGNEMILQIFNSIPLWNQEKVMPWMSKRLRLKNKTGFIMKEKRCNDRRSYLNSEPRNYFAPQTNAFPEQNVFYGVISENKEIQSLLSILNNSLSTLSSEVNNKLSRFQTLSFLWDSSIEAFLEDLMKTDPQMSEFIAELSRSAVSL